MDLKKKVITGFCWSAGGRFLSQLITWAITLIVIRLLTPADYGLMAMAGIFTGFLALLNELGLGAALVQGEDFEKHFLRKVFGLVFTVNFFLFMLLLFAAPLIASFFKEQRITPIIRVLSFQFIMMGLSTIPQSLLMRAMNFKKISVVDFVSGIVGSLTTLILALMKGGVWSLVWGSLASNFVRTIGLNLIQPSVRFPRFSFNGMRQIMSFGGYVTIGRILWYFYNQADIFIIGKLLGKDVLGFYSIGMELASLPMDKISGILNQIAFPAFSSIKKDPEKVKGHFLKSVRIISFTAFPVLWGISSISQEIVAILLGDKWRLAALPLQLLSLLIPFRMLSNITYPVLMGLGRPDIVFLNVLLYAVVMPLAILIGVQWGIFGVCIAWLLVFPFAFLWNLFRVIAILDIEFIDFLTAIYRPILASLSMYIIIIAIKLSLGIDTTNIGSVVMLITTGILVYSGMILTLNKEGCREMLGLIKI